MIKNILQCAFSEIVLAPKLFLSQSVQFLFVFLFRFVFSFSNPCGFPVCAVSVSVLCLITDGFVVSINVTLAGHYNVGHCLFLPHLEDKFMRRLFFFFVRYIITKTY